MGSSQAEVSKNSALEFDLNEIDQAFLNDPYPTYRALRENDPVHRNPDGTYFLTRYADVAAIFKDKRMSSDKKIDFKPKFGDSPLYEHHTTSLVFNDPTYHTRVRTLLSAAFSPRAIAELKNRVEQVVDDLLKSIEEKPEFDAVHEFATTVPTQIVGDMLGIPMSERYHLRDWSLKILGALDPILPTEKFDAGNKAIEEFTVLLKELIADRKKNPDARGEGEVLAALIFGEVDGERLTEKELIHNCIFLLNAGHETTTSLISNGIHTLLNNPEELAKLQNDPEMIKPAIEEFLRFQSPLQIANRRTTEDSEFSGVKIPAGTFLHLSVAGANRDPEEFENPDQPDIGRQRNRHLAFAVGNHICLGNTLSRIEAQTAIGRLVRRYPNLRANGEARLVGLARFRGFDHIPVAV